MGNQNEYGAHGGGSTAIAYKLQLATGISEGDIAAGRSAAVSPNSMLA